MKNRGLLAFFLCAVFSLLSLADPLEACKEHIKYGAPSNNPVLLCRLGYLFIPR